MGILNLVLASAIAVGTVTVTDGDTLTVGGERIRIANIDTPEIQRSQCDAERRLGLVAKRRLAQLVGEGGITIKRGDPATGRQTDRHGRTLALISVNGRDVGRVLIAEGLAREWAGRREPWCASPVGRDGGR